MLALDKLMNFKPVTVKANPNYGGNLRPVGSRYVDIFLKRASS